MKKIKKLFKILVFVAVPALLLFSVRSLKISDISCKSQYGECADSVKEKLVKIAGCDYLDCKKKIRQVLSEDPLVSKYSYQIRLPLKITVDIIQRVPKYSLKSPSSQWVSQVDQNGLALDLRESSNLPGLFMEGNLPNSGQRVTSEVLFALELVYGVSKLHDIESSNLENTFLSIDLAGGQKLIFPLSGDRDFLLGSTALILNELKKEEEDSKIKSAQINTIDLRFKNPVLR